MTEAQLQSDTTEGDADRPEKSLGSSTQIYSVFQVQCQFYLGTQGVSPIEETNLIKCIYMNELAIFLLPLFPLLLHTFPEGRDLVYLLYLQDIL